MQQHIFQFESEASLTEKDSSSHCSSVQERLVNYGSEALDTVEHLGLILKDQDKAVTLLNHFGSIANLARASVQDLSAFLSRDKAAQLVSSLRLAAVALREERTRLVIDTPLAVAELVCLPSLIPRSLSESSGPLQTGLKNSISSREKLTVPPGTDTKNAHLSIVFI
jgi:hypothetical protein